MTKLKQRMIEDLQLKGLSPKTQKAYVDAVRMLADYYHKSPDTITDEELRRYFLYLKNDKKYSRSSMTVALCGIKFFYEQTLKKEFPTLKFIRPARDKKSPVILSREEVRKILELIRNPIYHACLRTIYNCGLRINEGCSLKVHQIDSSRMLIHVEGGKGAKDRLVPLPKSTLELLRKCWADHRNPLWLFPKRPGKGVGMDQSDGPVPDRSLQKAFESALKESGVHKKASVHSLRHAYATHLLELGLNLRLIQTYLGHSSPTTTSVYTHLTIKAGEKAHEIINDLGNFF